MPSHLRFTEREEEEKEIIYAPFVVAIGLMLSTVLVTLSASWVFLGLAVLAGGVGLWIYESVRQNPDLVTPHPEYYHEGDRWHRPSTYWWGVVFYSVLLSSGLFAMLRVAHAHQVFDPVAGDLPLHDWMGHTAAAVGGLGLLLSLWPARNAAHGGRLGLSLGVLALVPLTMAVLMVWQATLLVTDPAGPDVAPRLAALFWMHAFEAVWCTAAFLALAFVAPRAALGHVQPQRKNVASAMVLFTVVAIVQFFLVWAFVYLGLLETSVDLVGRGH